MLAWVYLRLATGEAYIALRALHIEISLGLGVGLLVVGELL